MRLKGGIVNENHDNVTSAKRAFGQLLRRLREERGWSQKHLDNLSNIPWRTIFDIEHANKANLDHRTISALCTAFGLTRQARRGFFLTAGLKPDILEDATQWIDVIRGYYDKQKCPASVLDLALYIHSFNSYLLTILDFSLADFLDKHRLYGGITAAHFLFDADFNTRDIYWVNWELYASITVYYLRSVVELQLQDKRYRRTLSDLRKMQDFNRIWDATKQAKFNMHLTDPVSAHHPRYGHLLYWHLQPILPDPFFEHYRTVFYPPAEPETEVAFNRIRQDVPYAAYKLPVDAEHGALEQIV